MLTGLPYNTKALAFTSPQDGRHYLNIPPACILVSLCTLGHSTPGQVTMTLTIYAANRIQCDNDVKTNYKCFTVTLQDNKQYAFTSENTSGRHRLCGYSYAAVHTFLCEQTQADTITTLDIIMYCTCSCVNKPKLTLSPHWT